MDITRKTTRNKNNYTIKMNEEELVQMLKWCDKKSEIHHKIVETLMESISLADLIDNGYNFHTQDQETIELYKKAYLSNLLGVEV